MLDHLGEKLIARVSIGDFVVRFDLITIIMSWIVIAILVGLAFYLRRGLRQNIAEKPNRIQAVLDALIDVLQEQLLSNFIATSLARRMFPFISTLFLFVLVSNWLSVIPYLQSPTQNLNVTASLALLVFFTSHLLALRRKGGRRFLKGFIEPYPFMLPINLVSELAKPVSHGFRLFGNIFGGTLLITVVSAMIPLVLPVGLTIFFGLFIGLIQAFVFAVLAVAYINLAVES